MNSKLVIVGAFAVLGWALALPRLAIADYGPASKYEYVTLHWDAEDHTHVIRANGQVETAASEIAQLPCPKYANDRAFYMTYLMNKLVKEGYELAAAPHPDDIIMRRAIR